MTDSDRPCKIVICSICENPVNVYTDILARFLYGNNIVDEIKHHASSFQYPLDKHKEEIAAAVAKKMTSRKGDARETSVLVLTACLDCYKAYADPHPSSFNIGKETPDNNFTVEDYEYVMAG